MTALAAILLWSAYLARDVLVLVYISGLLAVGLSPMVRVIERQRLLPRSARRFPRAAAILVLYVIVLSIIALLLSLVLPPIVRQAQALWANLPDMFDRAQAFLVTRGILSEHLTLREAFARAPGTGRDAVASVFLALISVAGGVFGVITIVILTFYFLVDADNLRASVLQLFPREYRDRADAAFCQVTVKVSAWLGGQLLLSATIGVLSAAGFWALGVPYFYVLAVIAGAGEMIPMLGPVLSAIPAIAVAATVSLKTAAFVLVFCIALQQTESNVLAPRILSRQVGVNPITVIVALLIGARLLGVVGAILAVPTAAILQVVANEILGEDDEA